MLDAVKTGRCCLRAGDMEWVSVVGDDIGDDTGGDVVVVSVFGGSHCNAVDAGGDEVCRTLLLKGATSKECAL